MNKFLADFDTGLAQGRYLKELLPTLNFADQQFDIALCAHLLFTYSEQFSLDFHLQSILEMCRVAQDVRVFPYKQTTSQRIKKLTAKRNNRVDSYLHQASRCIIDYLYYRGIGKLIIGQNPLGQQEINNGKRNNQSFVSIPHARFVEMLIYKGFMKGIKVIAAEESYTSKASFLSLDYIPTYGDDDANQVKFSGYRETRGIYKIKGEKTRINADVNGSYNIMRKAMKCGLGGSPHEQLHQDVIPTVFDGGIEKAARWAGSPT
ncbi:MAG: IS200/IS605 family accessory protein TnpB-related protein [Xenococcus sp. (in: cyanobacteria)]